MSRNSFVIIMAALCAPVILSSPGIPTGEAVAAIAIYTVLLLIALYLDRPSSVRRLRFKTPQFEIELTTITGRLPISHHPRRIR